MPPRHPPGADSGPDIAIARTLDLVAVLIRAGLPSRRAWSLVAARDPSLLAVEHACRDGVPVGAALRSVATSGVDPRAADAWRQVGVAWAVADRIGAPAAATLGAVATALRQSADGHRAVAVALAGPTTSGRIVLALPLVGVLFGLLWGDQAMRFLLATPVGWACLLGAGMLVALARAWTSALVRRATPVAGIPGMFLEIWAVALSGGASRGTAAAVVADELGQEDRAIPIDLRAPEEERHAVQEVLALADAAGVPAVELLRARADDVRRDTAAARLVAAERLGARLVLPLGLCVLPAFVLVGVVPVIAGILSSTVAGLR